MTRTVEAHRPGDAVRELALALGFDLVGVARAEATAQTRFLREWVERGYAGELSYMTERLEERVDPGRVFEGARSVVVVGLLHDSTDRAELGPACGAVARYAGGDDYHDVLRDRLRALAAGLEVLAQRAVRSRFTVDTGPVPERALAAAAGLGWIGKNTCLIHPRLGSYLLLGALFTDLDLPSGQREPDHCGSCRACLDACPTDAFPAPYVLDATRCLSYTTIELQGPIPEGLRAPQGDWLFGCDICQEVCPWNRRTRRPIPADPLGLRTRLEPRAEWRAPSLEWVLTLSEGAWRQATRRSALRRARHRCLLRNALVVAGNSGDPTLRPVLEHHAAGADPMLAEHARWALGRLDQRLRPSSRARAEGRASPKIPSS